MKTFDIIGLSMLYAYAYVVLMLYITQWLYVKLGFEKLDQDEKAEPVTLKELFKGGK